MSYIEILKGRVQLIEQEIQKGAENVMLLRGHLAEATHHLTEMIKYESEKIASAVSDVADKVDDVVSSIAPPSES